MPNNSHCKGRPVLVEKLQDWCCGQHQLGLNLLTSWSNLWLVMGHFKVREDVDKLGGSRTEWGSVN